MNKNQIIIFFLVFGGLAYFNFSVHSNIGGFVMVAVMILAILFILFPTAHTSQATEDFLSDNDETVTNGNEPGEKALLYYGDELNFSNEELTVVLLKHLPFFSMLTNLQKEKFLVRLDKFIADKKFYIHDKSGFREMPVLISATAIQLSFSLEKYLLPNFESIHVFPQEFIRTDPCIGFLEGSVSGRRINLSWKHFLQGFEFPHDGQNVGLHEFAHAYYYQYFETGEPADKGFVLAFPHFNSNCNTILKQEQSPGYDLYSDYGLTNEQEFWAESVELFFEKPTALKNAHPDLYDALTQILKQDPAEQKCEL